MDVSTPPAPFVLTGMVLDAPAWGQMRWEPHGAVVVENGIIAAVGSEVAVTTQRTDLPPDCWRRAPAGQRWIILPGLSDVHAHIPQYPAVARVESQLLPWLQRHIFPREREFTARRTGILEEMEAFFSDLCRHGTTSAMLYAAVWEDSCDLAFAAAERSGLRISLGKVMMDVDSYGCGERLPAADTRELSIQESRCLIERWHGRDADRLRCVISPRFALTSSRELLKDAATLAAETRCALQTHLSENRDEVAAVARLFPEATSYTDVYRRAGLVGPSSVFAHCIHLSPAEMAMLAEAGAKIAHCPTANWFLNSGLFPLDQIRRAGITVGLGSDVAAGPELNLWQVMRSAIETQKARRYYDPFVPELTPGQALHLATVGGAAVLGCEGKIGQISPGFDADLQVLDLHAVLPAASRHGESAEPPHLTADELAALLVYRAGPSAVRQCWVRGKQVFPALGESRGV
ncbi:MAG: guanine deaminase [Verrucomicrobiales bacterium]|nr:guanine deaminase [Verrucomicrobiales bacterium]